MRTFEHPGGQLRSLLTDLVRWDTSFSRAWGTVPSREYVASFDALENGMLRASQSLRTGPYEELRSVGATLDRDAKHLASVSTKLAGMSARGATFGPGWDIVLDQAIDDVSYGLRLLGIDPSPQPAPNPRPPYPPQYPTPYPPQYPPSPDPTWPNPAPYPGDGGWGA